jgi:uncharacterized membrane protein YbhN (UPF0104 family)
MYPLGIGVLAGMIWWNWDPDNGKGLKDALSKPFHVGPLVIAASVVLAAIALSFVRWYLLVRALDLPFRLADAFRLGLVGFFFSQFLPGSVSGDVVKIAFLAREQKRRTAAAATVLVDRVIGVWGLICLVVLGGGAAWALANGSILTNPTLKSIILVANSIVGASLAVWLGACLLPGPIAHRWAQRLERLPKVGVVLAELWRAGWMYHGRPLTIALALGISMVGHTCLATAFYFCGHTFQDAVNPTPIPTVAEHFVFFPIGELIQTLPFLPGGVGLAEAGYAGLYKITGFSENTGMNVALIYRALLWSWGLVSYCVFLSMRFSWQAVAQAAAEEKSRGTGVSAAAGMGARLDSETLLDNRRHVGNVLPHTENPSL